MSEEEQVPEQGQQKEEMSAQEIEKLEEEKLKAKYPAGPGRMAGGHSTFLQKRLAKGQKFFDSGDYQMAKQKSLGCLSKPPLKVPGANQMPFATGEAIPTPETVPTRKTSLVQPSKLASNVS